MSFTRSEIDAPSQREDFLPNHDHVEVVEAFFTNDNVDVNRPTDEPYSMDLDVTSTRLLQSDILSIATDNVEEDSKTANDWMDRTP